MQRNRFISSILVGAIMVSLLTNIAYAFPAAGDADWQSTDAVNGTVLPWNDVQDSMASTLSKAVQEFNDKESTKAGAFEIIMAYGKVLAAADWFTNNYFTYNENQRSMAQNATGQDVQTILDNLNKIPGMAGTVAGLSDLTNTSAFNTKPSEVTAESVVGYDGYREALYAILNSYIEPGISTVISDITWDATWILTEEQTQISSEMVTALSPKRKELAPYASLYSQIFTKSYGVYLSLLPKTETQAVNNETVDIKGYTRADKYKDFVSDEFDAKARTICTWLSSDNGQTGDVSQNQANDGVNYVDLSKGVLPALANAEIIGGEVKVTEGENLELTALGYYVLAAGVIYDPFVSRAGNDDFIAVLKDFLNEADKTDELVRILQVAVNTKKPLYVTDGSFSDWVKLDGTKAIDVANYREARLADLLDIDTRTIRAYVCMSGKMTPSQIDSSTLDYVRTGQGTSSYSEDTATNPDSSGTASTGISSNATGDIELDTKQGYVTAGATQITASSDQVTAPVLYTTGNNYGVFSKNKSGGSSLPGLIAGMTSTILVNASKDCRDNQHIQSAETEMVFVNGLGDIVLADGTIILPAIANPALFVYTPEEGSSVTTPTQETPETTETTGGSAFINYKYGYYPYTASVLNHYPGASYDGPDKVVVSNPNDSGKYILSWIEGDTSSGSNGFEATMIKSTGQKQVDVMDVATVPTVWVASDSFSVREEPSDTVNLLPFIKMPQSIWRTAGNFAYNLGAYKENKNTFAQRWLQAFAGGRNVNREQYFPIISPEADLLDSWLQQAAPLVTSAVRYVSTRDASNVLSSSGKFRVSAYITDFVAQGMMGTQYSEQMVKNNQLSYEELVNNQYGRFTRMVKDFVSEVINTIGHIDGVLAIKDGYGNGFFNTVMGFVQEFYLVIAVVLLIIVATKFIRGRFSFFYVVAIGCLTFAAFNVYAVWMPTAVPAVYNFFVNDIVEEVTWNTVATTAEKYADTYKDSNNRSMASGDERAYTATITLYKMTQAEMEQVAEHANIDVRTLRKGEVLWLDRTGGIFVQGDQIKQSVDSLLANNTMRGLYKSQWDIVNAGEVSADDLEPVMFDTSDNPYILKLTEPYVSLETYYTPFSHFERAFLINLNNFASIFRVERNYYQYPGGLYKDAFLFNAYTDSGIFTAPGNDDVLKLSVMQSEILGSDMATPDDIVTLCHQNMDPMEDWLNLRAVFYDPNETFRASLWGKTMQRQDYYGGDWTMTVKQEEKVSDLIYYINEQTKQFIIKNQDQLNFLSDENAIKLVTLYATTCFTHRVSSFGYWLYPNYVNSCDIELVDVLYGAMTTYRDRNAALDGDLLNTVVLNLGVVGALLILIITVVSTIFVFILTYLVPVLYAMFGVILVYKLVNNEQGTGLVKGYVKVTLVSTLLYMAFSFSLRLVKFGGYQWYGYLMSAILAVLCLYFLFFVVLSVITNPLELGNDVLMRNLFGALDRLTGGRLGRLTSNHLTINSRRTVGAGFGGMRGFMHGDSVDDRWSGRSPRRGYGGYGRYDDYDDTGVLRGRLFGHVGGHLDGYSRTQIGYRNSAGRRPLFRRSSLESGQASNVNWGDRFDNFQHRSRPRSRQQDMMH